jgi:beta-glucosidase
MRTDTEAQVDALLDKLTLEEKVKLCHASSRFSIGPIERAGIPEWRMSDGPHGVREEIAPDSWAPAGWTDDDSTCLPAGGALAATWNPQMARLHGRVLGSEARHRKKDVILAPSMNIIRTPLCGRNFEYYSEDPVLTAAMAIAATRGIQENDVAACPKHYALNNQETDRHGVDVDLDEAVLREIYLYAFEAVVTDGDALTIMGAYNLFRGQHACHNEHLLNAILKGEWGFHGSVISDWGGVHDTYEAARYGMDAEMAGRADFENYFLAGPFLEAIRNGELDEQLATDKARRNLRVMVETGVFDPDRSLGERNTPAHRQAARRIAEEAVVLLKNENAILPLDGLKTLLVVGKNATAEHAYGGGSAMVKTAYEITPLEGLREAVGPDVEITYRQGYPVMGGRAEPIPGEVLSIADAEAGVRGWQVHYYDNDPAQSEPRQTGTSPDLNVDWRDGLPFGWMDPAGYTVQWEATLTPPRSGRYQFVLEGGALAHLLVDGTVRSTLEENIDGPDGMQLCEVDCEAGRPLHLRISWHCGSSTDHLRLRWIHPGMEPDTTSMDQLLEEARAADAVLFFGGTDHSYDHEGWDRPDLVLPGGQASLISELARANPATVVTILSGAAVEMPWADEVPAILHHGYLGMEGGRALAEILLGRVNPSGRLPWSMPRRLEDSPAHAVGDFTSGKEVYREGMLVGYRWHDAKGIEPLFPFGHGLAYTRFEYGEPRVELTPEEEENVATVRVPITNAGERAGAEVVQLYLGREAEPPEPDSPPRPPKELKAFEKVALQPGQTREVELALARRHLSFFSKSANAWQPWPGPVQVLVGASAADIRQTAAFRYDAP